VASRTTWARWHQGSVTDPKFQLVAQKASSSLPAVLAVWAYLLEKASAASFRSHFGEINCDDVDCLFGFDEGEADAILLHMEERGLICSGYIVGWDETQTMPRKDTTNAARQAKFRAGKKKITQSNATVTQSNATVTHSNGVTVARASKKCPPGFVVTQAHREWAAINAQGVDLDAEVREMLDYTFSTARTDWDGTFRNWLRKAAKIRTNAAPKSYRQKDAELMAARVASMGGAAVAAKNFSFDVVDMEPRNATPGLWG
jgi:hypothetical protein